MTACGCGGNCDCGGCGDGPAPVMTDEQYERFCVCVERYGRVKLSLDGNLGTYTFPNGEVFRLYTVKKPA